MELKGFIQEPKHPFYLLIFYKIYFLSNFVKF